MTTNNSPGLYLTRQVRVCAWRSVMFGVVCIGLAFLPLVTSTGLPKAGAAVASSGSQPLGPKGASWGGVSCVSGASCTVVGFANGAAAVISKHAGRWGAVHVIAGTAGGTFTAVSCFDALNCTAVGAVGVGSQAPQSVGPMVVEEHQGSWGRPIRIPGASTDNFGTAFTSVSCWSRGECFAVLTEPQGGMVAREQNGIWGPAKRLGPDGGSLNDVSCSTPGICYVVGATASGSGFTAVFKQRWHPFSNGHQALSAVSCASANNCITVGNARTGSPNYIVEVNGIWSDSIRMQQGHGISFTKVNCGGTAARCVAIGTDSKHSYSVSLGLKGATTPKNLGERGLRSLSCPTSNLCVAVGQRDNKGLVQVFHP